MLVSAHSGRGSHAAATIIDIIVLTVCAVISGAETWEDIEDYGKYKHEWLARFVAVPNGIPSHDTIRRLFNSDETLAHRAPS